MTQAILLSERLSFQEGITADVYFDQPVRRSRGDVDAAMGEAANILEGEVEVGGQEHVYMETQCSLVVPGEGNEWTITSGSQNLPGVQETVAKILGLTGQWHKIVVRSKRVGGGFGGKLSQFSKALWPAVVIAGK